MREPTGLQQVLPLTTGETVATKSSRVLVRSYLCFLLLLAYEFKFILTAFRTGPAAVLKPSVVTGK